MFAALAKIGAVFAPLNARASLEEVAPVAEYARPRLLLCGASHARAGGRARRRGRHAVLARGRRRGAADRARSRPSSTSATRTSSSSRAGAPAGPRASCCRTAPTGCAPSSARRRTPGGGGTVCMFPLFHMAGWTIALGAWQGRRPVHFVRTPDAETLLRRPRRATAPRGCIAFPRCGPASSSTASAATTCRRSSKPTPAPRRRRPSCSRAIKDALPHTVTRVFYGSTEAGPGRAARRRRPLPQAGQRRRRATRRRGAARRDRRGVHAQPVPDGRLLRRSRRDRRGAARRLVPHRRSRRARRRGLPRRSSAGRAT